MILVLIQNISSSNHLLRNASELAVQLGKTFGVLSFVNSDTEIATREAEIKELTDRLSIVSDFSMVQNADLKSLTDICETNEVSFLFLQLTAYGSKSIQTLLNACRELRIPYLLHKDNFELFDLKKVIMPVNFLEEEVEIGGKTYFMAHSKEYVRAVIEKTDVHKVNDLVKAKAVDFADEHVLLAICEDLY